MAAVLLVFQYGQPRIFFSMARDGLLPKWAARVHPNTGRPHVTTILTGVVVASVRRVREHQRSAYELTNIGTLFAFVLVSRRVCSVLRYKSSRTGRARSDVPVVWPVSRLGSAVCLFIMLQTAAHSVASASCCGWPSAW